MIAFERIILITSERAMILFLMSGRRESNPVYLLPKQAYYRYTTPRDIECYHEQKKIAPAFPPGLSCRHPRLSRRTTC